MTKKVTELRQTELADDFGDVDPNNTLGTAVRDVYLSYRRVLRSELLARNVTLPQWTFLRILWQEDGLTQKALSALVSNHPSTTVDTIRTLEREGFVERRPHPNDGRAMLVFLTKAGRDLRSVLMPCADRANEVATEGLSDKEIATLRKLLVKVRRNFDQFPTE
jgi:MarR family transcriptional regulator, organic hydroperoxide resistance regulator